MKNLSDINNIQAESGVICTLLYHPDFILHSNFLKAAHFYDKKNGCIYWAINELYKSGVDKIDSFNLSSMINSNNSVKKKMEEFNIASLDELIELASNVERNTIEEYLIVARQVTTLAFKRTLYKKLREFEGYCFDEKNELGVLNTKIYDELTSLSEEFVTEESSSTYGERIDDLWSDIKEHQVNNGMFGIPSKFPLQNLYCPYEKASLIIVAAPRKTGKSIYMMNEAVHKLKNGVPCIYLDSEMPDKIFTPRWLAHLTGIPVYKIKAGSYTSSEEELLNEARNWTKKVNFNHIYQPNWTDDKIYTTCKIWQYKIGLQFVIFDYIKSTEEDSSKQYNDLGRKTNLLQNQIAGGLDLAVLAGAQLNRKMEIGDSYKIEQYASTVMNLAPKTADEIAQDGEQCGNYKLNIKLNRNGDQMSQDEYIDLVFNGQTATIDQAKEQHKESELPI